MITLAGALTCPASCRCVNFVEWSLDIPRRSSPTLHQYTSLDSSSDQVQNKSKTVQMPLHVTYAWHVGNRCFFAVSLRIFKNTILGQVALLLLHRPWEIQKPWTWAREYAAEFWMIHWKPRNFQQSISSSALWKPEVSRHPLRLSMTYSDGKWRKQLKMTEATSY